MFLDQVILVSTVPFDSTSSSSSSQNNVLNNTYKHTPTNSRPAPKNTVSAIASGSENFGQIYQLELGATETFGVKVTPFTYKDSSIPVNCLTSFSSNSSNSSSFNSFTPFSNDINLLAYHPTLSALFVYAAGKDRPVSRSFGHERITCLQASPCSKFLLAGTESGCIVVWRVGGGSSGDLIAVIEGAHFQALRVVRFSPDGQSVASAASDALIKIWSWPDLISNSKRPQPLFTFSQHSAPITDLIFSLTSIGISRGRLLSASLDGKCNFYDLVDGQLLLSLSFPVALSCAALNATETSIYAAGTDGNIYIVHLNGNNQDNTFIPAALQFHKGPISSLQWSLDERVLISCGAEDGHVAFWDPQSNQLLKSILLTSKKVSCTNILVFGKSDPLNTSNPSDPPQSSYPPFKRIGNQLTSISSASPIITLSLLPESTSSLDPNNKDIKDKLKELVEENEELKSINSELCRIVSSE